MGMSRNGVLKRTNLVNNVTIQCDQIRRCNVLLDFALRHDVRRHIICNQVHLDAHLVKRGRGKLGTLKVWSGFRGVDGDIFALLRGKGK